MKTESDLLSIYVHIPFCIKRCSYCDFNTYAGYEAYLEEYVDSLLLEISSCADVIRSEAAIHSIYFGGGTPTLMQPRHFSQIINQIFRFYRQCDQVEITTEANPCELSLPYLSDLVQMGINRLSIGMQSAVEDELHVLGRQHSLEDVLASFFAARAAGLKNINLDLMFGIPGQTLTSFQRSLQEAIRLKPEHLSLYSLSLDDASWLARKIQSGEVALLDEDLAGDMYAYVMQWLPEQGYGQYEISNWSLSEKYECIHNLQYWRNWEYLGFGAGAHSHYSYKRWENIATIPKYIRSVREKAKAHPQPVAIEMIYLDEKTALQETVMMGLRLTKEGLDVQSIGRRFGVDLEQEFGAEIKLLTEQKLLEIVARDGKRHLRLTRKGRMLGNQVFLQFVGS